MAVKTSHYN